jgi:hypothetical protein
MIKMIISKNVSRRRMFSLLGAAAAVGLAAPTVILVPDAAAQTTGMQRRQGRRTGRHDRRDDRRTGRSDRREDRRAGSTTPK